METLKDQIALVTGGTGGIGGAIASGLAERGVSQCLTGQNPEKLAVTAASISATTRRVHSRPMDLTSDHEIGELAQFVAAQYGRLDILIHCAGSIHHGKLELTPVTSLD